MSKKFVLHVTELCYLPDNEEGYRMYLYETEADNFEDAFKSFTGNFDGNNVYDCEDLFEEECLESIVVKVADARYFR